MADDNYFTKPQYKTRSASISAPASTSLEQIVNSQYETDGCGNGESTPYRRRKPATRSQSARIPQGRSVRKKVSTTQAPSPSLYYDNKTQFASEPYLTDDNETLHQPVRRGSQRRPAQNNNVSSNASVRRKSNIYLDVPGYNSNNYLKVNDNNEDVVRTFSTSNKGIVNRGDSFRRRRSRSSSLIPTSPLKTPSSTALDAATNSGPTDSYLCCMLGADGVGKGSLISQFRTSECINAYESGRDSPGEQGISIILNGIESELKFITDSKGNKDQIDGCDAFLVVYSVIDKASFTRAEYFLSFLQDLDLLRSRCCILIGNKIDLARSRAISSQDGKCLACTYRVKFIEVSVGINHNVDELLAGTLTQIRLKKEYCELYQGPKESSRSWYKNRNVVRASMKARQMITWIFGKEDTKFKNCENLTTL
ncbi:hypothetical protein PVAND_003841 [Polypedilum vanderplanki]|uniref:Uncharacterized protein n=1 Tax=Polypedilum vanderplanki TaxID=319348 RepID=A0A9J6BWB5_POLVA|nr:hypothetical protein PVAND_003841 [Polypedilum vanderplanki]